MLYSILKIWCRAAAFFFFKDVKTTVHRCESQPTILACNHPNSFMDAMLIATYYPKPIYFLARGDAFDKKWVAILLRAMKLIPIYRLSEGKENLKNNEKTFDECVSILRKSGSILIFSEGISANQISLRPLKKGTARIYLDAVRAGVDAYIRPVWTSYSSFCAMPKTVSIQYSEAYWFPVDEAESDAHYYHRFNDVLTDRLTALSKKGAPAADKRTHVTVKILLALPVFAGFVTHYWYYKGIQRLAKDKTKNTVFYDSVFFTLLMMTYPIYVLLISLLLVLITGNDLLWMSVLLLPLAVLCYKKYRSY